MTRQSILFVCTGNICRSPLAEGIFSHLAAKRGEGGFYHVDSAGTGGWHRGEAPDRRSVRVAAAGGIDISRQRARQVTADDFGRFDFVIGMDRGHVATLKTLEPTLLQDRIHLFGRLAEGQDYDVPDPYYGDETDFEAVYRMLFSGCGRLLDILREGRAS